MSNFAPKLEDASDKELMYMVNELDFRVVPLASDELTRRYIERLKKTIQRYNKEQSSQTETMIKLTKWIVALTVVLVFGLVVQILIAVI